jgi:hypothetical protein
MTYAGQICTATHNAIFSQALADGVRRCVWRTGQQMSLFGPEAAPVSHSVLPVKDSEPQTSATSGPSSPDSLASASLQRCLENRLRAKLDANGSSEYSLTWKAWDMPQREPICALRASARRTPDSGCGGWPTPDTKASGDGPSQADRNSPRLLTVANWASPTARDWKGQTTTEANPNGFTQCLPNQVANWCTPQAGDAHKATPRSHQNSMIKQILGAGQPQSSAQTEKRAVLDPGLPRWLMGYRPEWCEYAVMAMQSFRK